jgi:hypothetical protein
VTSFVLPDDAQKTTPMNGPSLRSRRASMLTFQTEPTVAPTVGRHLLALATLPPGLTGVHPTNQSAPDRPSRQESR